MGENTYFVMLPQVELEAIKAGIAELQLLVRGQAKADIEGQWLDSEDARKLLAVSHKTWQTMRDTRVLPFSQYGRKIYVRRADIEAFLESKMVGA